MKITIPSTNKIAIFEDTLFLSLNIVSFVSSVTTKDMGAIWWGTRGTCPPTL